MRSRAEAITWDDYIALPDDDRRELIDGALVEVEVPTFLHEHVVAGLVGNLGCWTREHGGSVIGSGYKVRVDAGRAFMPDVQLYRRGNVRTAIRQQQGLAEGRPDLVVEVISPSSRRYDRLLKRAGYAAIGVPEYWLVEPDDRLIERFCLVDGAYSKVTHEMTAPAGPTRRRLRCSPCRCLQQRHAARALASASCPARASAISYVPLLYRASGGAMGDAVFAPESFEGLEIPLGSLWLDEMAGG